MARKAIREEFVSRSRTLKAASRAMRQAFRARLARSSGSLVAGVFARGRVVDSSSDFLCAGDLRGISVRVFRLEVYSPSVKGWLQDCRVGEQRLEYAEESGWRVF